jgi:fructose-1,6-bisphosphatase/inositol monophosphatase family enzyme
MVALVHNGEVLSAYIGDINTGECYGYRPGSDRVHRITGLDTCEEMNVSGELPDLETQYVNLRDREHLHSPFAQEFITRTFKNVQIHGGSIGIWMAQLWKREVGGALILPGWETPWDMAPIVGISKKLGYMFLKPNSERTGWQEYEPLISREKYYREHETLIIHRDNLLDIILDYDTTSEQ